MRIIKFSIMAITLGMLPFYTIAQSISASGSTLDDAEAKISAQAAAKGTSYNITSAQYKNHVYMTAKLTD